MIERAVFIKSVEFIHSNPFRLAVLALLLMSGCSLFEAPEISDAQPAEQVRAARPSETDEKDEADDVAADAAEDEADEEPEVFSEKITFDSLGDTLAGVIDRPDSRQTPGPAVLILHAAGPHDRRGFFKAGLGIQLPVEVPVYENIAHSLAKNGYVVMRFDKRTCVKGGRPWCTYPRAYVESQRDNLAQALESDARAALAKLQRDPRVDPSQIYILGHDQGAEIALATAESLPPAGLILLAPSPYPVDQVITHQIDGSLRHLNKARAKAGKTTGGALLEQQIAELTRTKELQSQGFAALRAGTFDGDELLGAPAKTWAGFFALHRRAGAQLSRHNIPLLAIFGSHDRVLPRESARAFKEISGSAHADDALLIDIIELPQITHFMVDIDPQASPNVVSERVQQEMLDFLEAQSAARD